ncbi:ribonuclease M5 [Gudongella oleilytica]|jgi:ribonuclease M5|uniref:ribonuclease M5 n=1 Tax=Gudongella oleilytica TaxID=1582259 RepID=UPI000FF8AD4C|nr:ribonuclease M5 [Gudongella oleilytica]MDY0255910.1 ribonuclease M5 [Gudongella oleilytica]HMM69153.1 ribonuclease M5 [Gudongella oleilytica]
MIKEVIVVEGRDDITAVKAALECEVIATNGFGYGKSLIRTLKSLQERRGLIILTDPDFGGERIRKDLSKHIPNCKHAFLPQGKALKKGDVGVENATPDDIREAIQKARPNNVEKVDTFDWEDILMFNLAGGKGSSERRERLGEILGIGYCNGKQILKRLNHLGVTRDEFIRAMERIDEDGE